MYVAKNMADFDAISHHFHENTSQILIVVTTDHAQFWAERSFHTSWGFGKL
jgi:hypothetical protein